MKRMQEVVKLTKAIRPYAVPFLYKYRSMKSPGLRDIFIARSIFLSSAAAFNDPFECRHCLTLEGSSLSRAEFLKQLTKKHFPKAGKGEIKKTHAR